MKKDGEIKVRQAKIEDIEQLCKARNNEKLFAGYLNECDGEKAHFLVAEIESKSHRLTYYSNSIILV